MTLKQYVSHLFNYRIKDGVGGWDDFTTNMEKSGAWSMTGSPRKFQAIIVELLKRVEELEKERDNERYTGNPHVVQPLHQ